MVSAAKDGLAAAAMKAKLFADHEEREIQRLSANIINHQVLSCNHLVDRIFWLIFWKFGYVCVDGRDLIKLFFKNNFYCTTNLMNAECHLYETFFTLVFC